MSVNDAGETFLFRSLQENVTARTALPIHCYVRVHSLTLSHPLCQFQRKQSIIQQIETTNMRSSRATHQTGRRYKTRRTAHSDHDRDSSFDANIRPVAEVTQGADNEHDEDDESSSLIFPDNEEAENEELENQEENEESVNEEVTDDAMFDLFLTNQVADDDSSSDESGQADDVHKATYGKFDADIDSIMLSSLEFPFIAESLNTPESRMALRSVSERTRVQTHSKIYIKGKRGPDVPQELRFAPKYRSRSSINLYPLHWFRNVNICTIMSAHCNIPFYVSFYLIDRYYIRREAYFTNFQMGVLNAAFNAALTNFHKFEAFGELSLEHQEELRAKLLNTQKVQTNTGSQKDPFGNAIDAFQNATFHIPHPYFTVFAKMVQEAFEDMRQANFRRWKCEYHQPSFHGLDHPFNNPPLQSEMRDIAEEFCRHGLWVAQAVGIKEIWSKYQSKVLKMSDEASIKLYMQLSFDKHYAELLTKVLVSEHINNGEVLLMFDAAVTVKPVIPGTSFLLNVQRASVYCKKSVTQINTESELAYTAGVGEVQRVPPFPMYQDATTGLFTFAPPWINIPSSYGYDALLDEFSTPNITAKPFVFNVQETQLPPDIALLQQLEEQTAIVDDIDDEDDLANSAPDAIDAERVFEEIIASGTNIHSYYLSNRRIGNVQSDHATILYSYENDEDTQFVHAVIERGIPDDQSVAACQIYMPPSRFLLNKRNRKKFLSRLVDYAKLTQRFLYYCTLDLPHNDSWWKLLSASCTFTRQVEKTYYDLLQKWQNCDRHSIRYEITMYDYPEEDSHPSWPHQAESITSSILQCASSHMHTYLENFMNENLIPLSACFPRGLSQEHVPPNYAELSPEMKTALVYHAQSVLCFIEVAPDFEGSITKCLRRNQPQLKLCKRYVPANWRTHSTPNHWSKLRYGIDPTLLPSCPSDGFDYNVSTIEGASEFKGVFRFPALFVLCRGRIYNLLQHFSFAAIEDLAEPGVYGVMRPPDYQRLANLGDEYRSVLLDMISDHLVGMYDKLYQKLTEKFMQRRHRANTLLAHGAREATLPKIDILPRNAFEFADSPYAHLFTSANAALAGGLSLEDKSPIRTTGKPLPEFSPH